MTQTVQSAAVQTALNVCQARPLARRAVRQGMPAQEAAWHAAMGVLLFNAVGAMLIIWALTGLPVLWLLVSGLFDSPLLTTVRFSIALMDTVLIAAIVVGSATWALNNPARLAGWRHQLARPLLVLGLMAGYLPCHIIAILAAKMVLG